MAATGRYPSSLGAICSGWRRSTGRPLAFRLPTSESCFARMRSKSIGSKRDERGCAIRGEVMSPPPSGPARAQSRFYGKYRGVVIDNIDPAQIGRIQAQVPDVLGEVPSSWALPCASAAGLQAGCFIVPPTGSQVWIEFEQGDRDYP